MLTDLYPFKFEPILKQKIWGGNKLKTLLGKPSNLERIGESWEISHIEGDISVVSNGGLKGQSLKSLLQNYKAALVGGKVYDVFGEKFPLLIKFIDAKEDLSIQLHPNNQLASERHNSYGKTEMWYVMQADDNANLIVGFNKSINKETYLKHLHDKSITKILNFDKVKEGDTYFIDVGRVHAIGAGVMLAEIQQTSDITYRVYDWDRVDDNGNARELHNDLAIDAIDFDMKDDFRINYAKSKNTSNKLVECPYFTTNYLPINTTIERRNEHDSFVIYMCVNGQVDILTDSRSETIKKGETILIPAAIKNFKLISKQAEVLEIYI